MALMFPTVFIVFNVVERRRRCGSAADSHRPRRHAARLADRLPQLPHADPDVGDDGDVHGVDDPAGRGLRRAHPARCSPPSSIVVRRRRRSRELPRSGRAWSCATSRSTTRAPRQPVLHGITFRSAPGETTAIIGSTGAGKTTLLNLIPRLIDATCGSSLLVDGVDVRDVDPDVLLAAHRAGAAAARTCSPAPSPRNLRYGKPDATDDELWEALEVAQAEDFVARDARRPRRADRCRAAPTCPAVSASGWPSPGRWSAGPRSTCSTTRSRRSTSPPTPRLRAALRP